MKAVGGRSQADSGRAGRGPAQTGTVGTTVPLRRSFDPIRRSSRTPAPRSGSSHPQKAPECSRPQGEAIMTTTAQATPDLEAVKARQPAAVALRLRGRRRPADRRRTALRGRRPRAGARLDVYAAATRRSRRAPLLRRTHPFNMPLASSAEARRGRHGSRGVSRGRRRESPLRGRIVRRGVRRSA